MNRRIRRLYPVQPEGVKHLVATVWNAGDSAADVMEAAGRKTADDELGFAQKLVYGAGEIGPGLADNAIGFFLLFYYTKIVQLDPALAGLALMVGRLWDAVTDPVMGYLSDRTRTRWGRRRPYLLFGALPYGLFFFLLWAPFSSVSGNAAFPVLLLGYLAFSTAATVCQVPFYTLGGELSDDYHQRSSIISFRQSYGVLGILVGGALTPVLVTFFGGFAYEEPASRDGWLWMAGLFGALSVVGWLLAGLRSRERAQHRITESFASVWQVPAGSLRAAARTLRNPHFRVMAATFLITSVSFTTTTATLPFLMDDWLNRAAEMPFVLDILILTMLPLLVVWVRWSRWLGKRRSYMIGLLIMGTLQLQTLWMFVPGRWEILLYVYPALFAVGLSCHFVFPWALMPDIIDYDELHSGSRQDGPYFGVMTFLRKSSAAISSQVTGLLLVWIGYDATVEVQPDTTLLGLRLGYAVIPGVAFLAGLLVFTRMSLTEAESSAVRRALYEKRTSLRNGSPTT
jgi:GPH family glycoside/pentoside/hexuronide:cation symporter